MKPTQKQHTHPRGEQAFSLIEVLVATAILVVIVIMVSMVFHQSSIAWNAGLQNAKSNMTARSILGNVQRELALAVDATRYGVLGSPMEASGGKLKFVALGGEHAQQGGTPGRSPRLVEYNFAGGELTRQETPLTSADGVWSKGAPKISTLSSTVESMSFLDPNNVDSSLIPLWVEITLEFGRDDETSGIYAFSYGPNGEEDKPETYADDANPDYDDIYSW